MDIIWVRSPDYRTKTVLWFDKPAGEEMSRGRRHNKGLDKGLYM